MDHQFLIFMLAPGFLVLQQKEVVLGEPMGQFFKEPRFFQFVKGLGVLQVEGQFYFGGNLIDMLAACTATSDGLKL